MLSKFASIIIITIAIVLRQSHVFSSPTPTSVFKTCYGGNRSLCFETDLSKKLDPKTFALGLDKLCPPGKTLPQIYGEVEQKSFQEYLATLPKGVKYFAPIGLKIKYRQWTEVIKANNLSDKNYLMMKLDKNSIVLQADDVNAKHPFGCVTKGPCPPQSSPKTKDPFCIPMDTYCLQINNNKSTYYDAINYCNNQNIASLMTYSTLTSNQKILTSLPPNVQELWAGETRVSLNWLNNNEPALYTHWRQGYPKVKAVFAYLKYDNKDDGWMSFQDGDLSSDDDDDDADEKYIAVCVGEEKPNVVEKPIQETNPDTSNSNNNNNNNNNDNDNDISASNFLKLLKFGLGLGLGLFLLLVLAFVIVLVVCLRYRKRRRNELQSHLGKTPSVGTVSSSASSSESRRSGSYRMSGNNYNNYVARDNFSNFNNVTRSNPRDNYGLQDYPGGRPVPPPNDDNNRIYEDIRSYEVPDGAPIVEHIYKAIRNLPVEYQRQLPQLPPERPLPLPQAPLQQQQPQYLQMGKNSYLELIV